MYEILDHTADAKFRAIGDSREKAFSEAVKAFAEIVGADPGAGEVRHTVKVEADDMEKLVYDFLHELIMLQEIEDVAVTHANQLDFTETGEGFKIEVELWTDPIEPGMNLMDIKAPTYNEMRVDYEEVDGWIIEAVLDI